MADEIKELKLKSYAKINLCIDVTGIREDGYHTVETVMQQVSLCDKIHMLWKPDDSGELKIMLSNSKPYLPTDSRNLAYKAALLMAEKQSPSGQLKIHIEKRIPVAAGLAGGSGNGAAVLLGVNRLWRLNLTTKELCRISASMGADFPFCVLTQNSRYKCALGTGIGDELKPISKGLSKYFVLAKPAFGVSTKDVFKGIDECVISQRPDSEELIKGLKSNDYDRVYENMINVLEEYTLKKHPEVLELKKKLSQTCGVEKVLMSGSGPTVIGIYSEYGAAKKACMKMRHEGFESYWAAAGKGVKGERNVKL